MSKNDGSRRTHAEATAWYAKYEGELHRLEAVNGGWSREIADKARAFADGISGATEARAVNPAGRQSIPESAKQERSLSWKPPAPVPTVKSTLTMPDEVAVDWDAAFGKEPATSRQEEQTLPQADAVDWAVAFGNDRAEAAPPAEPPASDALWDEAFGRQPAASAAASAKADASEFSWEDTIAQHNAEQLNRPRY